MQTLRHTSFLIAALFLGSGLLLLGCQSTEEHENGNGSDVTDPSGEHGFATPEAAIEAAYYAIVANDYDAFLAAVHPEQRELATAAFHEANAERAAAISRLTVEDVNLMEDGEMAQAVVSAFDDGDNPVGDPTPGIASRHDGRWFFIIAMSPNGEVDATNGDDADGESENDPKAHDDADDVEDAEEEEDTEEGEDE